MSNKRDKALEYLERKVNPILERVVKELLVHRPENVHDFIIDFMNRDKNRPISQQLKGTLTQFSKPNKNISESEDEDDDEEIEDLPLPKKNPNSFRGRSSISAEAYGHFNKKGLFVSRIIPKTAEQKARIANRLNNSFMFSALEPKEKDIVISSMDERHVPPETWIINQGEEGDDLYVIDSGQLECYKKFTKDSEPKLLKVYQPGESFGELALLYNAKRAASIKAITPCTLFVLDRETFNHIVKDSAIRKAEKFEEILLKIELLSTMDPYERSKIIEISKTMHFKKGEYIIEAGEKGDTFYFVWEGNAKATKLINGKESVVYNYKPGDYFGELALLRDTPRAANVIAETDLTLLALDREAFKRVLGPLEDILKRNFKNYEKFM